jgi:hypothetical protein
MNDNEPALKLFLDLDPESMLPDIHGRTIEQLAILNNSQRCLSLLTRRGLCLHAEKASAKSHASARPEPRRARDR